MAQNNNTKIIRRVWKKGEPAWSCPEHFRDEIDQEGIDFNQNTIMLLKATVDSVDRIIENMIGGTHGSEKED